MVYRVLKPGGEQNEDKIERHFGDVRKSFLTDLWRSDVCSYFHREYDTMKLIQHQKSAEA